MKIIKPGKVKTVRLTCPYCGCEFACSKAEIQTGVDYVDNCSTGVKEGYMYHLVVCPQKGCEQAFNPYSNTDTLPEYIDPTPKQSDQERLVKCLSQYFDIGDSYAYNLTRDKRAFFIGTMSLDDFEEFNADGMYDIADYLIENGVTFREDDE